MDIKGGRVGLQEEEDCRCQELPTGERICDPIGCNRWQGNVNLCMVFEHLSACIFFYSYLSCNHATLIIIIVLGVLVASTSTHWDKPEQVP